MVLAHVFRSLQPGGAFLLQMLNLPAVRASFRASESQTGPQGMLILEKRKFSQEGRWFEKRRTLFRQGKPLGTFHVAHRLFFRRELRSMLNQAGFGRVEFYGSLSGTPYRPMAPFLVAVAWKVK
jgi:hypothetical protein